jgi:Antitoxin MazE-like
MRPEPITQINRPQGSQSLRKALNVTHDDDKDGAQRVQRRRDKLRGAGLRPVQIWVPDTRAAGFAKECAR